MLFSVEYDNGSTLSFYVIPDAAGTAPSVRLRSGGTDLAVVTANNVRPEILASGRHATGQCGFMIDDGIVANLASYPDLEVVEAKSGLRVYRRRLPTHLESKVFRLETHLMTLRNVDDAFRDRFQFWYAGVDRHGSETARQVFHIHEMTSAYISGRILLSTVQLDLTKGYRSIAMLRDPYNELAERLIILKNIGTRAEELLGARDALTYEPVIEALGEVETFDRQSLRRFFRRAEKPVLSVLSNPLVRQLTCNTFEETPAKGRMGNALEMLAQFEVLGLRSDAATFASALAETFDVDRAKVPVAGEPASVVELGAVLRDSREAEAIIDLDLELYDHTLRAFALHVPGG